MTDYTSGAEALFRDFARRNSFTIERVDKPDFELLMFVPKQPGLSFELTLGLQNGDELNVGFDEFWSYFFPYEKKHRVVADALDALALGDCRLAIHKQFGGVVKRELERRLNGRWQRIYTAFERFQIPFLGTDVTYLLNDDARRC